MMDRTNSTDRLDGADRADRRGRIDGEKKNGVRKIGKNILDDTLGRNMAMEAPSVMPDVVGRMTGHKCSKAKSSFLFGHCSPKPGSGWTSGIKSLPLGDRVARPRRHEPCSLHVFASGSIVPLRGCLAGEGWWRWENLTWSLT